MAADELVLVGEPVDLGRVVEVAHGGLLVVALPVLPDGLVGVGVLVPDGDLDDAGLEHHG